MDIKRVASALVGLPLVILVLLLGNKYIVDMFLAIVAFLGMQEYFNAVSKETKPVRWIGYLSCLAIAGTHIVPENLPFGIMWIIYILAIPSILVLLFAQVVITNMKTNFKDIAYTLFGIIYIVGFIMFIALLRGLDTGKILIWYAIIAAWGTDTSAYIVGKRFGKHKFSEVSPKKSLEGCIAGIVGACLISALFTFIINKAWNFEYSYLYTTIIVAILSIIGQLGDFSASSIKRYVDVKDYSNLIPGHGGMLDRIDSLIFLAPFAYVLLSLV